MNIFDPVVPFQREATLRYLDADFQVLREGEFVRCAVTDDPIAVDALRYWDVARQVPYRSAEVAFQMLLERLR
jgi:hypothetical protein